MSNIIHPSRLMMHVIQHEMLRAGDDERSANDVRVRALIAKQDLGNSQMMALMVPFALSGRHLRPAPSAWINQAQSQRDSHPQCCESAATATPCWLTSWCSGQSSRRKSRSGSAHTCYHPYAGLGLSGERCPDHSSGITPRRHYRQAPAAPACGRA